jgi:hypothetical protein
LTLWAPAYALACVAVLLSSLAEIVGVVVAVATVFAVALALAFRLRGCGVLH